MLALTLMAALAGGESRFFEHAGVEFWGTRRREDLPPPEVWTDSSAPAPAKRLLESPTRENAEAYLAWQTERLQRLRAALAALEEARHAGDRASEGAP